MAIKWEVRSGHIYTLDQAEGALLNGTRVEKVHSAPGDAHRDGARGTIVGSAGTLEVPGFADRYAYFVKWDDGPYAGVPIGIRESRLQVREQS
jgi:hypothetical protein